MQCCHTLWCLNKYDFIWLNSSFLRRSIIVNSITTLCQSYQPPATIPRCRKPVLSVFSLDTSSLNLPACFPHFPLNAERQAGKLWIPILKSLVWPDAKLQHQLQIVNLTGTIATYYFCWSTHRVSIKTSSYSQYYAEARNECWIVLFAKEHVFLFFFNLKKKRKNVFLLLFGFS